jgi:hypothetical protein
MRSRIRTPEESLRGYPRERPKRDEKEEEERPTAAPLYLGR